MPSGLSIIDKIPSIHSIRWPKLEEFLNFNVSITKYWNSLDDNRKVKIKVNETTIPILNNSEYFLSNIKENKTIHIHATIAPLEKEKLILLKKNDFYLLFCKMKIILMIKIELGKKKIPKDLQKMQHI